MIKLMIHVVKIVIATVIALLFGSCKFDATDLGKNITGSGNVISKDRNISNFTKVEVRKGLDCEIVQSNTFRVVVEADDNLQDGITTQLENGTLVITSKYNRYKNVKSKTVKVFMPTVDYLGSSGGANLKTIGAIKANDIHLKSSSGSSLNAEIESEKVTLESSSGSTLEASGKAISLNTLSSSGSTIDAKRLLANEVRSQCSSGSNAEVNPILVLNAQASSGSSIRYENTPKQISKQVSSGGSISAN